jgi:hypothetical protein
VEIDAYDNGRLGERVLLGKYYKFILQKLKQNGGH